VPSATNFIFVAVSEVVPENWTVSLIKFDAETSVLGCVYMCTQRHIVPRVRLAACYGEMAVTQIYGCRTFCVWEARYVSLTSHAVVPVAVLQAS
jgi:hypothetical protein